MYYEHLKAARIYVLRRNKLKKKYNTGCKVSDEVKEQLSELNAMIELLQEKTKEYISSLNDTYLKQYIQLYYFEGKKSEDCLPDLGESTPPESYYRMILLRSSSCAKRTLNQ